MGSSKLESDSPLVGELPTTATTIPKKNEKTRSQKIRSILLWTLIILYFLIRDLSSFEPFHFLKPSALQASFYNSELYKTLAPVLGTGSNDNKDLCPQESPLTPQTHAKLSGSLEDVYATETFKGRAVDWLAGAVRIPTESYDDLLPVGQDPRWDVFSDFEAYLKTAFPKVHSSLNLTNVNTHALVYHWQGSDKTLLPILLAAHQDVVPVEPKTADSWTYPPYSGHYDGEWIWGRGSGDDKQGLIGILSSFETLLENGFTPKRTIVAAFGIDEEASGGQGAGKISKYLESTYGKDGFSILVDEGGGIQEQDDVMLAVPDVGEKGYLDVRVQLSTPGGHSSIPPAHTTIGLLAQSIVLLESSPHTPTLHRSNPLYEALLCQAAHVPSLNPSLRKLIQKSRGSDKALKKLEDAITNENDKQAPEEFRETARLLKAFLSTTQAVDLVEGGVKVNALPERASAVVNHRIAAESSVQELIDHLTELFAPFAEDHNLAFTSFGKNISIHSSPSSSLSINALTSTTSSSGTLELFDAWGTALEPAPISPTDDAAWKLLSGSILGTWEGSKARSRSGLENREVDDSVASKKDKKMIVAPSLIGGNTDTRYYWSLTRNIYRFGYLTDKAGYGIHTVDERIRADAFVDSIRFFSLFILNADESRDL